MAQTPPNPLPPRVRNEVQRILDQVARRFFEEHLAHMERKIDKDPACPVCKRQQNDLVRP